jgi:hypothetical protein
MQETEALYYKNCSIFFQTLLYAPNTWTYSMKIIYGVMKYIVWWLALQEIFFSSAINGEQSQQNM